MTVKNSNWSREEHILAFALYCQIPFGTIHIRNPKIQELARLLGRSDGSVSYKLANFSRLDPALNARGIKGMGHGAKGEEEIWREFTANPEALTFESQRLMAERHGQSVETYAEIDTRDLPAAGTEREAIVKQRVNQRIFRKRVLSAYDFRCCVTGLAVTDLLIASHIIPWAEDEKNRLNPRNGLCLNALHDRAFDCGLMWVEPGFKVRFSSKLRGATKESKLTIDWLRNYEGQSLLLSKTFEPDAALLEKHASRRVA